MKHILSFGGGLNSSALLVYLIKNKAPLDLVIFSDPGEEKPETYASIPRYRKYCDYHEVPFITLKGTRINNKTYFSILDYYEDIKLIPSMLKRDCTAKFKIRPIRRFLKDRFPGETFKLYIGIDYGEWSRVKSSDVKYIENVFPLVDAKIDRIGCAEILKKEGLPIPVKSGCRFCIYMKKREIDALAQNDPVYFDRLIKWEESSRRFPDLCLYQIPARSFKEKWEGQTKLFQEKKPSCEVSGGCFL